MEKILTILLLFVVSSIFLFMSTPVHEYGHSIVCNSFGNGTEWLEFGKVKCKNEISGWPDKLNKFFGGLFSAGIFIILALGLYYSSKFFENKNQTWIKIIFLPVILFQILNGLIEGILPKFNYRLVNIPVVTVPLFLFFFVFFFYWSKKRK